MPHLKLQQKLLELCKNESMLLWLEGSKTERIHAIKLIKNTLVLYFEQNRVKMVSFERYAITKVGLQYWSQGRPGVIYSWDSLSTWKKEGFPDLEATRGIDTSIPGGTTFDQDPQ